MKFLEDNNTLLLWMTITIIPLLTGTGAFGGEAREIEGERKKKRGLQLDPPVISCREEGFTRSDFNVPDNISMTSVLLHTQLGIHLPELHSAISSTCSEQTNHPNTVKYIQEMALSF